MLQIQNLGFISRVIFISNLVQYILSDKILHFSWYATRSLLIADNAVLFQLTLLDKVVSKENPIKIELLRMCGFEYLFIPNLLKWYK